MTPNNIDLHLMISRSACEEIIGEFPMADQEEARRREAEMNRTPHHFTSVRGGGIWNAPAAERDDVLFTTGNTSDENQITILSTSSRLTSSRRRS
jgi:hypothetical protein